MDLWVQRGERESAVKVERIGPGRFRVELGDEVWEVDSIAAGSGRTSLRLARQGEAGARGQFEVSAATTGSGRYRVATRRATCEVEVLSPLEHLSRQALGGSAARGPEKVTAYMPGRVVAILVDEGAEVEAGQGVVVLEAMKMENEIQAEHAGTIRRLLVEPGQSVEAGEPLFELD